ncbi:MAG: hypothetical protein II139_09930 [Lachnospiraceae bacterium]|nr:hypothetical protein [Lachnospiraceae bacterium]
MNLSLVSTQGSPKSKMLYHEDASKLHVGTLPTHAWFVPFDEKKVAEGADPFGTK